MNRLEIRTRFRNENPEITDRVIADSVLNDWLKVGDKEVCAITRCIYSNTSEEITTVVGTQYYDLEANITKFFDIDDMPGGGVYYDNEPLKKTTPGEMNYLRRTWKSDSNGTPKRYWRRGQHIWLDVPPDEAVTLAIDCVFISNDFDEDTDTPYNGLLHLEPYHDALCKYLQWRVKAKVGKPEEASIAQKTYMDYVIWMKKMVKGYKSSAVFFRPSSSNAGDIR